MFEICLCNNFKNGFGCILTNDCDSDDEDFGPNGYLFYVKIAIESEKKVRSGLWVAQLKSPADRFEFIGETIIEKSAEKTLTNYRK
uniref:Uncharacterized protein n=1 Tax=Globodera rostochiensis TaxID=31243 RepID=A0A914I113_GLORO